jgi:hypothetical protein
MKDPLRTKVVKLDENEYHCYLIYNGNVYDELICTNNKDVAFCFRDMAKEYIKVHGDEVSIGGIANRLLRGRALRKIIRRFGEPIGPIYKGEHSI